MTPPRLFYAFLEQIRYTDRRVILSALLAVGVALLLIGLVAFGPVEARFGSAIGLIGLLVAIQLAILFFRPPDRSPFGLARAAFAEGDFAGAAAQLEPLIAHKPTVRSLTLLGNSYRQLGRLDDALTALERALALGPKNAFALYGMGRIQLTLGNFDKAADWFDRALAAGAPAPVACDLGFAEYFAGNEEAALRTLQKTTRILQIESYRVLLTNAILHRIFTLGRSQLHEQTEQNIRQSADGLAYWQDEIERHAGTPYAQALRGLIDEVEAILEHPST